MKPQTLCCHHQIPEPHSDVWAGSKQRIHVSPPRVCHASHPWHTIRCLHPVPKAWLGNGTRIKPKNMYTCRNICPRERARVARFNTLSVAVLQSSVLAVFHDTHPTEATATLATDSSEIPLNPREFVRKHVLVLSRTFPDLAVLGHLSRMCRPCEKIKQSG
jgi:hypothetical protein